MCTTTRGDHFPACNTTAHFINIMESSENIQPNRMEYHAQKVQKHCRVCVCSREGSFNHIQMPGVCTAAVCRMRLELLLLLKKIQLLFHLASAVAASIQWLIESLQQLKVCLKDAPLSHSNGATTVMRIAWYEKIFINVHVACLQANKLNYMQVCEHFDKLRKG